MYPFKAIHITCALVAFALSTLTFTAFAAELQAAAVARVDLPRVYRLDGIAEAVNRSTVSAQTAGRVTEVSFDVDDFVRAGDVIVRIEDSQQQAALAQAEANLQAATARRVDALKEFTRIKGVFDKGAVAKADLDRASAALKETRAAEQAADAAREQARQELDYTVVKAPYNGIVTERMIEVGETAQPGKPLMSGLSLDRMRISVDVPQNLVDSIRREGKAQAQINERWIAAQSVTVFPVADPRSDTFKVRLELPEGTQGVFPGMYVKVGFVAGVDSSLVIPLSAIVLRSEVVGVYIVDEAGAVRFRHVRLGSPAGPDHVSILAGLHEGEMVATDPVAATIALKSQRTVQVADE
ncbi:MAG: efflux RND transporter periplasmic adaptor subunit [Gammaproteobacteria bacterium]|nr:efflux RND transporter periplasmic adaptor subunit [Gammaproteobacteria bacterium]